MDERLADLNILKLLYCERCLSDKLVDIAMRHWFFAEIQLLEIQLSAQDKLTTEFTV